MKRSEAGEILLKLIVDRGIAFAFPLIFLLSFASLLHDALPFIPAPGAFFMAVVAAGGIMSLSLSAVFRIERAGTKARTQTLALALLALYGLGVALNPEPFPDRLMPGMEQVFAMLCFAEQWIWSGMIESFFTDRELLLEAVEGKTGNELYADMRDEGFLLSSVFYEIQGVSLLCTLSSGFLFTLTALACIIWIELSAMTIICVSLFFFLLLLIQAVLRFYEEEQLYAGLGLSDAFALTRRKFRAAFVLLLGCAGTAMTVSSDKPVLPPTIFLRLLALLERLFAGLNRGAAIPPMPRPRNSDRTAQLLRELAEAAGTGGPDLSWLVDVLKYVSIVALVLGTLYFLFGSFFRRDWKDFWRDKRLMKYLRAFLLALRDLWETLRDGGNERGSKAPRSSSAAAFRDSIRSLIHPSKTLGKRLEIGRLTKEFLKIVDWGDERGIACRSSWAPGEYAGELSKSFPVAERDLALAANLFEKALYSASLLEREEEQRFTQAVKAVLSADLPEDKVL